MQTGGELLERAAALEDLGRWADEAGAGTGRLVLVSGEAGIGKTSLLRAFADGRRRVFWGACDPLTTPRPFGPLMELAPALGGPVARVLSEEPAAAGERVGQSARDPAHSALFGGVLDALTGGPGVPGRPCW